VTSSVIVFDVLLELMRMAPHLVPNSVVSNVFRNNVIVSPIVVEGIEMKKRDVTMMRKRDIKSSDVYVIQVDRVNQLSH
jgi:hypothetical protein